MYIFYQVFHIDFPGAKSNDPFSHDYIPSIFKHVSSLGKRRRKAVLESYNERQLAKSMSAQ